MLAKLGLTSAIFGATSTVVFPICAQFRAASANVDRCRSNVSRFSPEPAGGRGSTNYHPTVSGPSTLDTGSTSQSLLGHRGGETDSCSRMPIGQLSA